MSLEDFTNEVTKKLEGVLGIGYTVCNQKVTRNNGIIRHAIIISDRKTNISPCIYVDEDYEEFIRGKADLDDIAQRIYDIYQQSRIMHNFDVSRFMNWESVKSRIGCRLVNTEKNAERLKELPHREYLDLSLIYYVLVEDADAQNKVRGSVQIYNDHMRSWGIDENTLYEVAWSNMKKIDEASFDPMLNVIAGMIGAKAFESDDAIPMYVLSSKSKVNGAVYIYDHEELQKASEYLQDDFWILPSSTHETILIPYKSAPDSLRYLSSMVREVNAAEVADDEILSDHVYKYERTEDRIIIAA